MRTHADYQAMIRVTKICRKCGAKIFSDAPRGLCTACVLETALGIFPDVPVGGVDSSAVASAEADGATGGSLVKIEERPEQDLPLEIAHLLLIDVVGYSKLLVNEQVGLLQSLNQTVRATESFRSAEAAGKLIRVPTGDGMALLFFQSPEEPVRCALEISRALQEHPHIQLRMGVHSGPVSRVPDVNDKTNIAGSAINLAQRVLDCGDAGHILLSKHIAEDLASYRQWQLFLHDLGECEVKHGLRLHLFNLYKDGFGNPQVPKKLRPVRRGHGAGVNIRPIRAPRWLGELGDYELLEEIGRGGQGVVFRARQKSLNRIVALKVISLGQWASQAHVKRFRREAEAAAGLEHPGIVPIHEVGERDGQCYFSMKFIEGGQLDEVVKREPMSIRHAVELMAKVARTVHYAHEHSILHRDIKPGNILLDADGEPHLTDFGLARLVESESTVTRTMEVLGTPSYMAPEQAVGNNAALSSVTDVYGLGAVFYQLLTGQPPFAGGTTYETIKLVLDTEPRQPRLLNRKIDRDLSTICLKCLEKDPRRRYPSALALAEDLERWLKHEPIQARRSGIFTRGRKWVQRNPSSALLAASLVALLAAAGWIVWKSELIRQPLATGIAVLPFENLNDQKENSVFADGVQDDILTKLAKIGNLKVISRNSVMEYRGKRNMRQIGDALRVSHVLEGSARRSGDRIHLNAQLIDTRTDTHVWAEEYDRDLNDLFTIQSEIAQKVAERLRAKLSASEKASVEERPTRDLIAYDFYARAVSMIYNVQVPSESTADTPLNADKTLSEAVDLLNKAVTRDPNFFLAYCQLALVHDLVYDMEIDHTPTRLALAQSAIDSAFRLRPDSGEAHLALGWHLYWGYLDYDRARAELALAQQSLPNNPVVYELAGSMDRSQRRWADATQNLERACELDPRNLPYLINLGSTYLTLHDYDQHIRIMDRIVALHPERRVGRIFRASVEVYRRADTGPWRAAIEDMLTNEPGSEKDPFVASQRYTLALYDRDWDAAERAAPVLTQKHSLQWSFPELGRDFWVGVIARLKGDETSARAAFMRARAQQEEEIRGHPDVAALLADLGLIDAGLGRKEEALNEGRRAMELLSSVKNSYTEPYVRKSFAIICAWTGERELALGQLEALIKIPGSYTYGNFRLSPLWDPLRGDPRFEKIVASLAPKETVSK